MNNPIDLVKKSLEYYDKNNEKYSHLYKKIKFYKIIKGSSDIKHSEIYLYDKDKKLLFKSRFEYIGAFDNITKIWLWGWANPESRRSSIYISRKILNYGLDIPIKDNLLFLKTEFITSRFKINNSIQLDIHAAIASYIAKIPMIFQMIFIPSEEKYNVIQEIKNIEKHENYSSVYLFLLDHKNYD